MTKNTMTLAEKIAAMPFREEPMGGQRTKYLQRDEVLAMVETHLSRPVSVSSEDRKMFEKYAARMSLDIRYWEGGYMIFQTQKAWEVWCAALEADRAEGNGNG